jgi:hypothetical protein
MSKHHMTRLRQVVTGTVASDPYASDYGRHSRAAREIATENNFRAETLLARPLNKLGV